VGWQALTVAAGIGIDRRQAISTLDAVLGTRSFDIQQCLAQAAVVVQRRIHYAAQVGIDDEGLPVQHLCTGAICAGGLPVRRDRRLWALVGRGQRTASQGGDGQGQQSGTENDVRGHRITPLCAGDGCRFAEVWYAAATAPRRRRSARRSPRAWSR